MPKSDIPYFLIYFSSSFVPKINDINDFFEKSFHIDQKCTNVIM